MAAQNKLFQRLFWLVDTIYSAGSISRDEIDRRWVRASCNDTHESRYPERTFHRHRETIYEMLGIEIVCDHATRLYTLSFLDDVTASGVRQMLLDSLALNNTVNLAGELRERIVFEQPPAGIRYISTIVAAMREERQLRVTYRRFDARESHSFLLAPYCLKIFKQRWYLVGKPEDHPEETDPRVYALDRVLTLTETDEPYHFPKSFKAGKFFEGHFGVDRRVTQVEEVRVFVTADAANYLRTLPIHESQQEMECHTDYSIFVFRVAPTYDFIQELRKHGSNLEVLAPASLRDAFQKDVQEQMKRYKRGKSQEA